MTYRFATDRADFRDLASGFVLRSAPGFPGFPIRLASEMFQRANAHLPGDAPRVLWDALCGSGYLATVLGILHRADLAFVHVSDADDEAVRLAERNLELLTRRGLRGRQRELVELAESYGKAVHREAAEAAGRLVELLDGDLPHAARPADVFGARPVEPPPDVVLSDVPYGDQTRWRRIPEGADPVPAALRAIATAVPPHAVLALSARTRKIGLDPDMPVLERFRVGLRAVVLVRAGDIA